MGIDAWNDCTSYSQNDTERVPKSFEFRAGRVVRICVTCGHRDYKPEWVMLCREIGIDIKPLSKGLSKEEAIAEAIAVAKEQATKLLAGVTLIETKTKEGA